VPDDSDAVGRGTQTCRSPDPGARQRGILSLEAVLILPLVALLVLGLFQVAAIGRDLLVLHEAARAGVRAAATSTGTDAARRAAERSAPELRDLRVTVTPSTRRAGDLVQVEVRTVRRIGPVQHGLRARAVAQVEPAVG